MADSKRSIRAITSEGGLEQEELEQEEWKEEKTLTCEESCVRSGWKRI